MTIVWGPTAEWQLKKPLLSFSQSTIKCCSSPVVSDRTLKFSPVPEELTLKISCLTCSKAQVAEDSLTVILKILTEK